MENTVKKNRVFGCHLMFFCMDRLDQNHFWNGPLGPESFFAWTAWTRTIFGMDRLDQSQKKNGPLGPESFFAWTAWTRAIFAKNLTLVQAVQAKLIMVQAVQVTTFDFFRDFLKKNDGKVKYFSNFLFSRSQILRDDRTHQ